MHQDKNHKQSEKVCMRRVRTRDFSVYINYSLFIVGNGKNYHNAVGPVSVLTIPDNVG